MLPVYAYPTEFVCQLSTTSTLPFGYLDLYVCVSITCVDVAKQVLNRCVASTPEKVELDYSFVEDHTNEDAR